VSDEDLYGLCVERDGEHQLAFLPMPEEEGFGRGWVVALYTESTGEVQDEHLIELAEYFTADTTLSILPVDPAALHDAMRPGRPSSVILDGRPLCSSPRRKPFRPVCAFGSINGGWPVLSRGVGTGLAPLLRCARLVLPFPPTVLSPLRPAHRRSALLHSAMCVYT